MSRLVRSVLPNKMRLLVWPMPGVPAVCVQVAIAAGSRCEKIEKAGTAHFLEHMFFKGGKEFPTPKAVAVYVESVGGFMNAGTSGILTMYYVCVPARHRERAFAVLADMLLNATFPAEELERERGIIHEENAELASQPLERVSEEFEFLMYGDQPAGWSTVGYPETVDCIRREDLFAFMEDYYTARNTVVTVAGAVDPDEAHALTARYLPHMPSSRGYPKRIPRFNPALREATRVFFHRTDGEITALMLGVPAPPLGTGEQRILALGNCILGTGMSSRLSQRIREDLGLVYGIESEVYAVHDCGAFAVTTSTRSANVAAVIAAVIRECERFAREGPTQEEVDRAKVAFVAREEMSLAYPVAAAQIFSAQECLRHAVLLPRDMEKLLAPITPADIRDVFARYFKEKELRLAAAGSFNGGEAELLALLRFPK